MWGCIYIGLCKGLIFKPFNPGKLAEPQAKCLPGKGLSCCYLGSWAVLCSNIYPAPRNQNRTHQQRMPWRDPLTAPINLLTLFPKATGSGASQGILGAACISSSWLQWYLLPGLERKEYMTVAEITAPQPKAAFSHPLSQLVVRVSC